MDERLGVRPSSAALKAEAGARPSSAASNAETSPATGSGRGRPRSNDAFDAHLATCDACAAEWAELRRTRELVGTLASDQPTQAEINAMWNTLQAALPAGPIVSVTPQLRGTVLRLAAARLKLKWAAAAVLFVAALAGAAVDRFLLPESLINLRERRAELDRLHEEYEKAWALLGFEQLVQPQFDVLTGSDRRASRVRVSLSPRIQDGFVRDVFVNWGDSAEPSEPIFEAEGTAKSFHKYHDYRLPPTGESRSWTVRVRFIVTAEVSGARRLRPEDLEVAAQLEATTEGIRLVSNNEVTQAEQPTDGPAGGAGRGTVTWIGVEPHSDVCRATTLSLILPTGTEKVTLLVRPTSTMTYFVQPGARRPVGGAPESFDIELPGGAEAFIGEELEIVAIASDVFDPARWSLEFSEVPFSRELARIPVRKVAGVVALGHRSGELRAVGTVCTSHGAALAVSDAGQFHVVKVLERAPSGAAFDVALDLPQRSAQVFLLVMKPAVAAPVVGAELAELPEGTCWVYRAVGLSDRNIDKIRGDHP